MDAIRQVVHSFFVIDSIWSIVFRGAVWFALALIIIISTDVANPQKSAKTLKSNIGFFLLFLVVSSGLMYLLFGFVTTSAATPA